MIGTKLYKGKYTNKEYADLAVACNQAGNLTIEDKGEYYEVVEIPAHIPTEEEIQKLLTDGVQAYMDGKVQERNYDNVHTCVGTYLYSPIEKFRKEAEAVRDWVSYVWARCYEILAEVKAGKRPVPSLEEVINELPKLDWGADE